MKQLNDREASTDTSSIYIYSTEQAVSGCFRMFQVLIGFLSCCFDVGTLLSQICRHACAVFITMWPGSDRPLSVCAVRL